MVIVIRTDIPMGTGKIASQAAHAAIALYGSAVKTSSEFLKIWLKSGQAKVVLKINNGESLKSIYEQALASNLNACIIYDADRTQVEKRTLTAVGIGPCDSIEIDKITGNLKLL